MLCVMQMCHKRMGEAKHGAEDQRMSHKRNRRACGKAAGSWGEDSSKPMLVKRHFFSIHHPSPTLSFSPSFFLSPSPTHTLTHVDGETETRRDPRTYAYSLSSRKNHQLCNMQARG